MSSAAVESITSSEAEVDDSAWLSPVEDGCAAPSSSASAPVPAAVKKLPVLAPSLPSFFLCSEGRRTYMRGLSRPVLIYIYDFQFIQIHYDP